MDYSQPQEVLLHTEDFLHRNHPWRSVLVANLPFDFRTIQLINFVANPYMPLPQRLIYWVIMSLGLSKASPKYVLQNLPIMEKDILANPGYKICLECTVGDLVYALCTVRKSIWCCMLNMVGPVEWEGFWRYDLWSLEQWCVDGMFFEPILNRWHRVIFIRVVNILCRLRGYLGGIVVRYCCAGDIVE